MAATFTPASPGAFTETQVFLRPIGDSDTKKRIPGFRRTNGASVSLWDRSNTNLTATYEIAPALKTSISAIVSIKGDGVTPAVLSWDSVTPSDINYAALSFTAVVGTWSITVNGQPSRSLNAGESVAYSEISESVFEIESTGVSEFEELVITPTVIEYDTTN